MKNSVLLSTTVLLHQLVCPLELSFALLPNEPKRQSSQSSVHQLPTTPPELPLSDVVARWAMAGILATSLLFSTNVEPVNAVTKEATRIEVNVETDYLLRVLEYFDGDMKKSLGTVVRSPFTTVKIDPPIEARDPLLRALYSFSAPEDYVTQASWLTIQPKSFKEDLLEKKFYSLPIGENKPRIFVSKLDIILASVVLSYPIAFGLYKYENYQEEQQAIAKKAAIKAKKAAAAKKKAAAAKKKKGAISKKPDNQASNNKEPAKQPKQPKGSSVSKPAPTEVIVAADVTPQPTAEAAPSTVKAASEPTKVSETTQRLQKKDDDGGMDAYAAAYEAMVKQQQNL